MNNIFFDFDGTLIDISEKYYRVYRDFMCKEEISAFSKDMFWRMMRRVERKEVLIKEASLVDRYRAVFVKNIEREKYLKFDKLFPHTKPTLRYFKKKNIKLFLVTSRRNHASLFRELKKLGLEKDYFERILVAKPFKNTNGNFKMKIKILKNIARPGDLIVGDSKADIVCGKKLKLVTIGILSGIRNRFFLKKLSPDYIFSDISSIKRIKELQ